MRYLFFIVLIVNFSMGQDRLTGRDVRIYKDTPVWEAALAIRDNDLPRMKELLVGKPDSILNYKETYFGQSLLNWAVHRDNFDATKILAELGADPNQNANDSTSALINATDKSETSDYLRLLLKYGGDANAVANIDKPQRLRTPLIAAAANRLESVVLLIETGANADYIHRSKRGNIGGENVQSALIVAASAKRIEIVRYLIIDVGVDFTYVFSTTISGEPQGILFYLRNMLFPLNTKDYEIKMQVVNFLKQKGLDYWAEPIPAHYKKQYDKAFLDKY